MGYFQLTSLNKMADYSVMFEKAIVAYIDILGYKELVEMAIVEPVLVKRLEDLFYGASVEAVKKLSEIDLEEVANEHDKEIQDYFKRVVETVRVRCIADSFIFTLSLSDVNFKCKLYDEKTTVGNCIETYLSTMTMFSVLFTCKMGHFLRGGMSIGKHYESERTNQFFIFSEAHNKAVTMESKIAQNPRIIIDESLKLYLNEISQHYIPKFFYKDDDGFYCLDIYSALHYFDRKEGILLDIKQGILLNMQKNFDNKKEFGKLLYFAKYHNGRVNRATQNFSSLAIDLDKYEERYRFLKKLKKPKRR